MNFFFFLLSLSTSALAAEYSELCEANGRRIVTEWASSEGTSSFERFFNDYKSLGPEEMKGQRDSLIDALMYQVSVRKEYDGFIFFNEPGLIFNEAVFFMGLRDLSDTVGDQYPYSPKEELIANVEKRLEAYAAAGAPDISSDPDPFVAFGFPYEEEIKAVKLAAPYFWAGTISLACSGGFAYLMENARLRNRNDGYFFIYSAFATEYLTNPKYFLGTMKGVQRIYLRLKQARGGEEVTAKVFEDLVSGFRDAGAVGAEAERGAYMVLMFYGLRGATFNGHLRRGDYPFPDPYEPLIYAQSALSFALSYLDKLTFANNTYYSLPAGITSSCVYGKAYRFWLAAFQSYLLKTERKASFKAALAASQATSALYSAFANFNGRQSLSADYTVVESDKNNSHRIDLVYSALGATVPYLSGSKRFDAGAFFQSMVKEAKAFEAEPEEPSFDKWAKVIAPYGLPPL